MKWKHNNKRKSKIWVSMDKYTCTCKYSKHTSSIKHFLLQTQTTDMYPVLLIHSLLGELSARLWVWSFYSWTSPAIYNSCHTQIYPGAKSIRYFTSCSANFCTVFIICLLLTFFSPKFILTHSDSYHTNCIFSYDQVINHIHKCLHKNPYIAFKK